MRRSLLLGALVGCGGADPPPEPAVGSGPDDLRATGYAGWDEDADAGLSGVTRHLAEHTCAGVTLYADEGSRLLAIDLDGRLVHAWTSPGHDRVEHGVLLDGGRAVLLSTDQGVTLLDRDSNVVWRVELSCHHDLWPLPDGGLLVPVHTERGYRGRRVRFDALVRLDAGGHEVGRWDLFDARQELAALHAPSPLDAPAQTTPASVYDYFHLNAISVLPADAPFQPGAWLVCLRNVDLLAALDPVTRVVGWSWGPGVLDAPHHPSLTSDGNVLVFDNGRRRGWSRVLEVDPTRGEIVWQYRSEGFFSDVRGACQRLPNGNTLITESERGRLFEVTRAGEVVWEYWNPELEGGARRRIQRATRVPPDALR